MGGYTIFDGYHVTLHKSDGSIVGSWDAISGALGHQKPSEQNLKNVGPLLEGTYSFSVDQVTPLRSFDLATGVITPLLALIGIDFPAGRFPGSIWAWGTERVELSPDFNTGGRDRFFIHGGATFGSRGCIDLGPNEAAYFAASAKHLMKSSSSTINAWRPKLILWLVQRH